MTRGTYQNSVTDLEFHLLLALADRQLHGYALIQEIRSLGQRYRQLRTGTLYAALHRLTIQGLLRESSSEEASQGPKRRTYGITPAGLEAARSEARRIHRLTSLAAQKDLLQSTAGGER